MGTGSTPCTVVVAAPLWVAFNALIYSSLQRLELAESAAREGVALASVNAYEPGTAELRVGSRQRLHTVHYRLFRPHDIERNERLPVLLFLHGSGQRGTDNLRQLRGLPADMVSTSVRMRFRAHIVVPQCPEHMTWTSVSPADSGQCDPLAMAMAAADHVLRTEQADPERLYLVGYSMGAFGAWALAAKHPGRFAAVVPIAGGGDPERTGRLDSLPIRVIHGDADSVVPIEESRRMVEALRQRGGKPLFDELRGVGHDSWKVGFVDNFTALTWLSSQRLGTADPASVTQPDLQIKRAEEQGHERTGRHSPGSPKMSTAD